MWSPYRRLLWLCLALALPLLACSLPRLRREAPTPTPTIAVSKQAAEQLERKLQEAWESKEEPKILLRVTDEEITSYLNLRLQEQGADLPIQAPRVRFTDGKIYLSGQVRLESPAISGQGLVVATPILVDGRVQVEINRAAVGPFPVPRPFLQQVTTLINDRLAEVTSQVKVQRIEVSEGALVIEASRE